MVSSTTLLAGGVAVVPNALRACMCGLEREAVAAGKGLAYTALKYEHHLASTRCRRAFWREEGTGEHPGAMLPCMPLV